MSKSFTVRSRRAWGATLTLATIAVCVCTVAWNTAPSSAAVDNSPLGDLASVSSKLEELHQQAAARVDGEEDDEYENGGTSWGHVITPERAVSVAQLVARATGLATMQQTYIELQTRNGRAVYAIRFGAAWIHIDADLGTVVP